MCHDLIYFCSFANQKGNKMGKIYTKSGDSGTTSLVGGKRIKKQDELLEAYGTCDELNSFIALLMAETEREGGEIADTSTLLRRIQNTLFDIGGLMATLPEEWDKYWKGSVQHIETETEFLETAIDKWESELPPLKQFILPGGNRAIAAAHICRTVCRRLERRMVPLTDRFDGYLPLIKYVNRLSDFFFILARILHQKGHVDVNSYQFTK